MYEELYISKSLCLSGIYLPFSYFTAGKSRFGSLLLLGQSSGKTDRLYMRGPGGRGEVEVAVSGVTGSKEFSPT